MTTNRARTIALRDRTFSKLFHSLSAGGFKYTYENGYFIINSRKSAAGWSYHAYEWPQPTVLVSRRAVTVAYWAWDDENDNEICKCLVSDSDDELIHPADDFWSEFCKCFPGMKRIVLTPEYEEF